MFPGNELEQQPIDPLGRLVLDPVRRLRKPFEPAVVAEGEARLGRARRRNTSPLPQIISVGTRTLGSRGAPAGAAWPRDTSGSWP